VLLPDHVHTIHYPHVAIHAQLSHLRISASYVALFVYKCGASSYTYIHTPIYFLTYTYLLVLSVIIHIRTNSFYTSLAMLHSLVHTYIYILHEARTISTLYAVSSAATLLHAIITVAELPLLVIPRPYCHHSAHSALQPQNLALLLVSVSSVISLLERRCAALSISSFSRLSYSRL
jgi:hypothetical protein